MAGGFSAYLADKLLGWLGGTGPGTAPAVYVQLHTGDPGANGTSSVSSVTTREAVTFSAASGGTLSASNEPAWTSWAGTNGETEEYISLWDNATYGSGNFLDSVQLEENVTVNTGNTLTLQSLSISFTLAT
jgi:hypothetical protein